MNHADHVALLRPGVPTDEDGTEVTWADLGSGGGAFTLALADLLGPGATIISIDRDRGALDRQGREVAAAFPATRLEARAADFTTDLGPMPPLDGLVMANSLHFVADRDKARVLRRLAGLLRPGGRFLLVEYDADRGNPWVPHPLSYPTWERLAAAVGLAGTRRIGRVPSRFLGAIYSAASERPALEPPAAG